MNKLPFTSPSRYTTSRCSVVLFMLMLQIKYNEIRFDLKTKSTHYARFHLGIILHPNE